MTASPIARSDYQRVLLAVGNARIRHAKSVSTLPDGEIDDLDDQGRTLDQAITDAVLRCTEATS